MNFLAKLRQAWAASNSLVCVGLDPEFEKLPISVRRGDHPFFDFNRAIVEATKDLVCAFKPQIAHYSALKAEEDLEATIRYIREHAPHVPVILDAKRGDIGNTANRYVEEAFGRYGADAVTVNPYMGGDTLRPFLDQADKGVVILCRTSNPGARDLQDLEAAGEKLYRIVARKAATEWNYNGNVLLVVGATYPEELREVREIAGDMPLLVPGVGAQGGDVEKTVRAGRTAEGTGIIVNSSRGILFASSGDDFADAARAATLALRDTINRYR